MIADEKNEYWSETFEGLDFSGKELAGKEFDDCTFRECNFTDGIFSRCNFVNCEFSKCNLSVLQIERSKFSDVIFHESKVIGVNWTKASWPGLIFTSPIKFYKSLVSDCSFHGLSLQDFVLEECKAHNVDFREGDFSDANFSHSDLSGSFFNSTNLTSADFREASGYDIDIYQNIIKGAKFTRYEAVRLLDCLEIELLD